MLQHLEIECIVKHVSQSQQLLKAKEPISREAWDDTEPVDHGYLPPGFSKYRDQPASLPISSSFNNVLYPWKHHKYIFRLPNLLCRKISLPWSHQAQAFSASCPLARSSESWSLTVLVPTQDTSKWGNGEDHHLLLGQHPGSSSVGSRVAVMRRRKVHPLLHHLRRSPGLRKTHPSEQSIFSRLRLLGQALSRLLHEADKSHFCSHWWLRFDVTVQVSGHKLRQQILGNWQHSWSRDMHLHRNLITYPSLPIGSLLFQLMHQQVKLTYSS